LGLIFLFIKSSPGKKVILFWFLFSPIAAALTFQSPHALRSQNEVIPLSIITAFGIVLLAGFLLKFKNKIPFAIISLGFVIVLLFQFKGYLYSYYVTYPDELPMAWQYGFSQIAAYTQANYARYDKIIISDRYDQPYILIAFFQKYPPQLLQKELVMGPIDNFGFSTGRSFGKYEFRKINYDQDKMLPNTLLVSADEKVDDSKVINTIKSPSGITLFKFISTK